MTTSGSNPMTTTRREFIKTSGKAVAAAALARSIPVQSHAGENNTIKVALVGCGGRGTGAAANALATSGPTKLHAMADVFEHRINNSANVLSQRHPGVEVAPERRFVGFDAFKHAIDSLDKEDVVLLAAPPAFRPMHLEYAVQKGVHVFMEKSFAVDAPGIRRVLRAGEVAAQKNLKIASGLMSRHYLPLQQAVEQIHYGAIGTLITSWAYRMHGAVGLQARRPDMNELGYQIANYSCFTWLNGSFIVDWLIHNIDVCCWAKQAWPVSVQGMGARQVRREPDQLFDQYGAEYTFPDGTRMHAQGRHINKCWDFFGNVLQGATGSAVLGEGVPRPRLFRGYHQTPASLMWDFKGTVNDPYQTELDRFFHAIRHNEPHNETDYSAKSCLTAIMGRMACESGRLITWDEALASDLELAPGLETLTWNSNPPVSPDADGRYPIAMPGETRVL
jgi:myo-inositol 2-dehydrogenase / D-chiro-inositol 1-dehydrogenase